MDLKENAKKMVDFINENTNLLVCLSLSDNKEGYFIDIYKCLDNELEHLIKRYDNLEGHLKYLRGMFITINMLQVKDLELV